MCRLLKLCLFLLATSVNAGLGSVWGPILPQNREPDIIDIAIKRVGNAIKNIAEEASEFLGLTYRNRELKSATVEDDPYLAKLGTEEALRQQKSLQAKVDDGEILNAKSQALLENLNRVLGENSENLQWDKETNYASEVGLLRLPPKDSEAVCQKISTVVRQVLSDGEISREELEHWMDPRYVQTQNSTQIKLLFRKLAFLGGHIYGETILEFKEAEAIVLACGPSPIVLLAALLSAPQSGNEFQSYLATVSVVFLERVSCVGELSHRLRLVSPKCLIEYWLSVVKGQVFKESLTGSMSTLNLCDSPVFQGKVLGKGVSAEVVACSLDENQEGQDFRLAFKRFSFQKSGAYEYWYNEAFILAALRRENCVNCLEPNSFRMLRTNDGHLKELGIIFERMPGSLASYLQNAAPMRENKAKLVMKSLLTACLSLHSVGISHNDLKPANILLDASERPKISDFGHSGWINLPVREERRELVTLWYRAPEAMLGNAISAAELDMWSLGCILGELLLQRPLFPGQDTKKMFPLQVSFLGVDYFARSIGLPAERYASFFPEFRRYVSERRTRLEARLGRTGMNFLLGLLDPNPKTRMTAEQALKHAWFQENLEEPPSAVAASALEAAECSDKH